MTDARHALVNEPFRYACKTDKGHEVMKVRPWNVGCIEGHKYMMDVHHEWQQGNQWGCQSWQWGNWNHSIYVLIIVAYVVWSFLLPDASWTNIDCGGLCGVSRKHWNQAYHFLWLFYIDSTPAPYMFSNLDKSEYMEFDQPSKIEDTTVFHIRIWNCT